jgi:uncharacterized membrane protein
MSGNPEKAPRRQEDQLEPKMQRQITLFEGPLPDPETLQRYKEVYPESVKIIFEMAKDYQDHIIKMDIEGVETVKKEVALSLFLGILGQICVLCVAFMGVILAYFRPELGKAGFSFSAIVCGYLIWWKTQNQKK